MKPTHDIRDKATGCYIPSRLCDACNKPAGTDPLCDDEVTGGHERPGFILCERKRCSAKLEKLGPEERRAIYEATVAERQGFNPNGRPRRPKGEPTDLNIMVLDDLIYGKNRELAPGGVIYKVDQADLPHLRRIVNAGWLVQVPHLRGHWVLSPKGRDGLEQWREENPRQAAKPNRKRN